MKDAGRKRTQTGTDEAAALRLSLLALSFKRVCAATGGEWARELDEIGRLPSSLADEAFSMGGSLAFLRGCASMLADAETVTDAEAEAVVDAAILAIGAENRAAMLHATAFPERCRGAAAAARIKAATIAARCRAAIDRAAAAVESIGGEAARRAARTIRELAEANGRGGEIEAAISLAEGAAREWRAAHARRAAGAKTDEGAALLVQVAAGVESLKDGKQKNTKRRRVAGKKGAKERKAEAGTIRNADGTVEDYDTRMKKARAIVTKRMREGKDGGQMLAACRWTCKHYGEKVNPRTGEVETRGGLLGMTGEPLKPETLRDYIRRRKRFDG